MTKVLDVLSGRRLVVAISVIAAMGIAAPLAGAQTDLASAPGVDVNALANGIFDALTANLTTLLVAAGTLAGVFIILRMAKRWFGARSSA